MSLTFGSCEKTYVVSKSQDILFQADYIKSTRGNIHWGIYVDVNGNILTYNLPEKWNIPHDDKTITQKEVIDNIAACKISDRKIPREELQKYINYIDNIAASKVTAPKNVSADAGTLSYYCYQYSESSSTYKRTVIKMTGDIDCENLNFYSKKVVDWMNGIRANIH
jgi:hypothetical protein